MPPLLDVRDVHKRFGRTQALVGAGFQVPTGEIFGLLGPNGAGKTTLLSIISGLLDADAGAVLLDGQAFHGSDHQLRRLIGLVPQELAIYQELSAVENLRFFGELYGLAGAALERKCDEVLQAIGLAEQKSQRVGTFSGGMKRRLNLGVALIHGPRLLLLDEPTAGVDPQSRHHIFEEVRRLNREGVTIVYTTHYMEEVQALCKRVAILDHGRVIACDELPNLLRLLPGRVRFRLAPKDVEKLATLTEWPGAPRHDEETMSEQETIERAREDGEQVLESDDVKALVLRLADWVNRSGAELTSLHVEEANLERVFLHLTGRELRD